MVYWKNLNHRVVYLRKFIRHFTRKHLRKMEVCKMFWVFPFACYLRIIIAPTVSSFPTFALIKRSSVVFNLLTPLSYWVFNSPSFRFLWKKFKTRKSSCMRRTARAVTCPGRGEGTPSCPLLDGGSRPPLLDGGGGGGEGTPSRVWNDTPTENITLHINTCCMQIKCATSSFQ